MSEPTQWALVAVIAKPHALNGGIILKTFTRTPEELLQAPVKRFYLRRRGKILGEKKILKMAVHKGAILLHLEGVRFRDEVESLRGTELVIPEQERWELPDGQYYVDQLEGLEVIDQDSGDSFGPVLRVQDGTAHDYLIVAHPKNSSHEMMIPKIDHIVLSIDLQAGKVMVKLPEGLVDI